MRDYGNMTQVENASEKSDLDILADKVEIIQRAHQISRRMKDKDAIQRKPTFEEAFLMDQMRTMDPIGILLQAIEIQNHSMDEMSRRMKKQHDVSLEMLADFQDALQFVNVARECVPEEQAMQMDKFLERVTNRGGVKQ